MNLLFRKEIYRSTTKYDKNCQIAIAGLNSKIMFLFKLFYFVHYYINHWTLFFYSSFSPTSDIFFVSLVNAVFCDKLRSSTATPSNQWICKQNQNQKRNLLGPSSYGLQSWYEYYIKYLHFFQRARPFSLFFSFSSLTCKLLNLPMLAFFFSIF